MRHMISSAILIAVLSVFAVFAAPVVAASDQRCFQETGQCIEGNMLRFWERNNGLVTFGYPLTPQRDELINGVPYTVQWFERARLELHPDLPPPYHVQISPLGIEALARQGAAPVAAAQQSGCRYIAETGHNLCGPFAATWLSQGVEFDGSSGISQAESIMLFGLPISEAYTTTRPDGTTMQVQWFERARFELHPDLPAPGVVFGRLGAELYLSVAILLPLPSPEQQAAIDQVLAQTNLERAASGCPALRLNTRLGFAAQRHSDDMAVNDFFSHTGSDGSHPADRARNAGFRYRAVAENIAAGQRSSTEVVQAWMNSPSHRVNILNCDLREIGIGYQYVPQDEGNAPYVTYWTQLFGSR